MRHTKTAISIQIGAIVIALSSWALFAQDNGRANQELSCDADAVSLTVPPGETAERSIRITNDSGRVINWTASNRPRWLEMEPSSGELKAGESVELILYFIIAALDEGIWSGDLVIDVAGSKERTLVIPVTINLTSEPAPPIEPTLKPDPVTDSPSETVSDDSTKPDDLPHSTDTVVAEPVISNKPVRYPAFGVNLSYLLPGSGDIKEFDSAPFIGLFYRRHPFQKIRLGLEAGVSFGVLKSSDGNTKSQIIIGQASALYYFDQDRIWYGMGGLELLLESYKDELNDESDSAKSLPVNIGAGVTLLSGRLDFRLYYSYLIFGDNIPGWSVASVSYLF
ncbi:MAG: hypothetical protein ABIH86_07275 [Planctomycetota bacterium]